MNIFNFKIRGKISLFITVFLLSLIPQVVNAGEAKSPDELASESVIVEGVIEDQLSVSTLEELQKDLANRLILGIFGKDALVYSLGDNVSDGVADEIAKMSMEDVQNYSKPFNVGNLNGLLMILSSFFFVAFTVLAMYFCWVMLEGLFNTQASGAFFGDKTSTLFSVLKSTSAMILIVPAYGFSHQPFSDFENKIDGTNYGSFSISQVAVFKAVGFSNQFANHIWGSFVNNYEKAFPTIELPNTFSKEPQMKEILNFALCVRSVNNGGNANVGLVLNKGSTGSYNFKTDFKDCHLEGSIKYDSTTIQDLKDKTDFSETVNSAVDYESFFNSTINKAMSNVFTKASSYADIILAENTLTEDVNRSGSLVNSSNWQKLCDTPSSMFVSGAINSEDLITVQYYMEKCMSEEFVLSFISPDIETARSYYDNPLLNSKRIGICQEKSATSNGERTFLKTSEIGRAENNSKTIEECLAEICTGDNGLYQCSSAIDFARTASENERMIKQGWLTAGAYSYSLFTGFTNHAAQELISSLSATFDLNTAANVIKSENGVFNYSIPSSNQLGTDLRGEFIELTEKASQSTAISSEKSDSVSIIVDSASLFGDDGLFGIHKFVTCSKNPMSVTDGFTCGNITEEMHDMGAKMTAMAIELKLASSAAQLFSFTKSYVKPTSATAGTKKTKDAYNLTSNVYIPLLKILGIGAGSAIATTTAFSDMDSYWIQNRETFLTVIALFSNDVPFMNGFINFVFYIILMLGLVFGFLLPLLPYFLSLVVISGWATMFLSSLMIAPIWAATLISPSNSHTTETAKKGLLILLTIILRAPFLVIGLVLAWLLSNILIGSLLEISNISDALLLAPISGFTGYIDAFVKLIIYLTLVYFIYNLIFSIIEGFYEIGINWLFGSSLSPFASKDRSEKWQSGVNSAKSFIGVK